ncbi:MAG: hypothetical protein MJZ17_08495 [Bacteroidales bacterium]|nr:hypothetical protein [Bacteroidales bacterium]
MADRHTIEAEITTRVDKLLKLVEVESGRDDGYDPNDLISDVLDVFNDNATPFGIKNKALILLMDILKYEASDSWVDSCFLEKSPIEVQKTLFTVLYDEMIKLCFGWTPENIEFSDLAHDHVKEVLDCLKDKSLLGDIRGKILSAAIDYEWKDVINMILEDDTKAWPDGTLDIITVCAIKKEWNEIIVTIINDDKFSFLKEGTIYCLFDYFYTDVNRFHSELNSLYNRVEINLSSSFSGIICRDEERFLKDLSNAHIAGLPFLISYYPFPGFLLALHSSPAVVSEVLVHQRQWIQMRASQISGEPVNGNVSWWSIYNGLLSDNRGLITDVDSSLIGICNSILEKSGFNGVGLPLIVFKDEEKALSRDENWFNVLGEYIAEKQEVILYGHAIAKASLELDVDENILRAVVLIHELGHYITHAHPLKNIAEEPFDNVLFSRSDPDFLECIAQLVAYWVTERDGQHNSHDVFNKLASKQSGPYKVYLKYLKESPKIILQSIAVLRANDKVTTISDFDMVINKLKN